MSPAVAVAAAVMLASCMVDSSLYNRCEHAPDTPGH